MARTVREAALSNRTARARLRAGRQPHWRSLAPGVTLGWQRFKGQSSGRWLLRRHIGKNRYRVINIARADDVDAADGTTVLNFEQAEAKGRALVALPGGKIERMTVRQAMAAYIDHLAAKGRAGAVRDVMSRGAVHILPVLGELVVSELTREVLQQWLSTMAAGPAQKRPKAGKPMYRAAPAGDDAVRRRRNSANRVWTMLRAALNYAFAEGQVSNDNAWRRVESFEHVDTARVRYLTIAEAQRLINAADPDFRLLVRAGLESGARYGELCALKVHDFNGDAGTLAIGKSKSGKARHVVLSAVAADFFRQQCVGRGGDEVMFLRADGREWRRSDQKRPMAAAVARAKITPAVVFHQLRHTWASLAVMNEMPLMVVARNLGHVDTTMVQKHYGHLAEDYITQAIRKAAPNYNLKEPKAKVTPLR